jgi:hypothetical protein
MYILLGIAAKVNMAVERYRVWKMLVYSEQLLFILFHKIRREGGLNL